MKPSPILCARVKRRIGFSTKMVGKGFYRGSGTGSLGAHTPKGGYLIDYRKVRHFVKPDLQQSELTPFVSAELYSGYKRNEDDRGNPYTLRYNGMKYLEWFRNKNAAHYDNEIAIAKNNRDNAEASSTTFSSSLSSPEEPSYRGEGDLPQRHQDSASSTLQQK